MSHSRLLFVKEFLPSSVKEISQGMACYSNGRLVFIEGLAVLEDEKGILIKLFPSLVSVQDVQDSLVIMATGS